MDLSFLFLPPIYTITLIVSAVITGLTFDYINKKPFILASATLFFIFALSQLIYRILEDAQPDRLVGQIIYFYGFLAIVYMTRIAKGRYVPSKEQLEK